MARKNGTPIKRGDDADSQLVRRRKRPHRDVGDGQQRRSGERAGSSTRAGSEPTARRTRCGATSPTKPIEPATATAAPTPSATPTTTIIRTRPRSTPSEAAASSPSVSARKARGVGRQQKPAREAERRGDERDDRCCDPRASRAARTRFRARHKGLGARLRMSAVMAPAKLAKASPASRVTSASRAGRRWRPARRSRRARRQCRRAARRARSRPRTKRRS